MLFCFLFLINISDKSRLQQYLRDGYKDKLDVTLLPDWEQLHVSEIFTQSILVCDEAKSNEERYRKLGTYRDLFYNNNVLQKRVVLLGEAGTGKTTFSKHLTDVWCESSTVPQFADVSVLKQFHYFFYVSCRFAKKNESILDMITKQLFDDKKMSEIAIYVLKNHPESCFVLIDGADEWEGSPTSETGRRGDIVGLPSMAGVADSVILITSRPWRFYALSKKTQDIFMRIKINGIDDVQKLSYRIFEQLEDPNPMQSSSKFLRQVRENVMYELMNIPLICLIALGSWIDDNSLHKSMCINYINMLQTFIRRSKGQGNWPSSINKLGRLIPNLNELEVKWELQSNELPGLLSKYKTIQRHAGLFLPLGHLAFDLLIRKNEKSLVFPKAVIESYLQADGGNNESINICLAFGILSKTETTMRCLKKKESFAFCHKTFQEFFAALWLASKYAKEKSKLHECIKNVDDLFDYEMLITFLCGIDPMAGKQLWLDLAENVQIPEVRVEDVPLLLEDMPVHFINEGWKVKKLQELVCKCMKQQELDPMDQTSDQIYFCIPNIIIFNSFNISDEDILLLYHVLAEYSCNVKSLMVYYTDIKLGANSVFGENNVGCSNQSRRCCLPCLDLQKSNKLEQLSLLGSRVECLLLPVEGNMLRLLFLTYVTMTHHDLEQLSGYMSSCSCLEALTLDEVKCMEQSHSCCLPVLDLQQHNKLQYLYLSDLSVEVLLLPVGGDRFTSLKLRDVTINHQYLEQLSGYMSSYSCLEKLSLDEVKCNEQSHSCCLPVLDLQKHNTLQELKLWGLSVEGLLLPVERDRLTLLSLYGVTMNHQYLEQLSGSLSSYSCLEKLRLDEVKCSEQSHSCCLPVFDLQKHNKLKELDLWHLSVKGLLLPVERDRLTHLRLYNVTMNHQYLEQLSGSLSSYSSRPSQGILRMGCSEHSAPLCQTAIDMDSWDILK